MVLVNYVECGVPFKEILSKEVSSLPLEAQKPRLAGRVKQWGLTADLLRWFGLA